MYKALKSAPHDRPLPGSPLHEFLPQKSMTEEIAALAKQLDTTSEKVICQDRGSARVQPPRTATGAAG